MYWLGVGIVAIGSSPLARGTQQQSGTRAAADRLIPARAGNTMGNRAKGHSRAAHPRSRGEHVLCLADEPGGGGSSPLARGTQD